MGEEAFACRTAPRLRVPVAIIGLLSASTALGSLIGRVPNTIAAGVAAPVTAAAFTLFVCQVFDRRFHNAVSALNADRRKRAKDIGWRARLFGWGLPVGDRLLHVVALVLIVLAVVASDTRRGYPAFLAFVAAFLVLETQIALMARGYQGDRFAGWVA